MKPQLSLCTACRRFAEWFFGCTTQSLAKQLQGNFPVQTTRLHSPSCASAPCSLTAEAICQEERLLQLAACLYSRSLTAPPSHSASLESINRNLSKQRQGLLLLAAGHLAAVSPSCLYTFFSQLLLGKPAQMMNYRRLSTML